MGAINLENGDTSAKQGDPFAMFNEVGCVNEQIKAAALLLSDELHDEFERRQEKEGYEANRRLHNLWLLLELIRGSIGANDEMFHKAESILYSEGVQREFAKRRAA